MKKIALIIAPILLLSIAAIFIFQMITKNAKPPKSPNDNKEETKLTITASFYPLAEFSAQVGGDKINLIKITPAGVSPHDYEPTAKEIEKVSSADIFIFNGGGFDPWAERLSKTLKKKDIKTIEMTAHFELLDMDDNRNHENDARGQEDDSAAPEHDGEFDPHIWTDPVWAQEEVNMIMRALIDIDPTNADYYKEKAANYKNRLKELDKKYSEGLKDCEIRYAIASHSAFNYLAQRYNIEFRSIALSPNDEPSSREIAALVKLAKEENIEYVFFETLVSPKIAETIAREAKIKTLVLNPVEGLTDKEIAEGVDYIEIMEKNLDNLKLALRCKND